VAVRPSHGTLSVIRAFAPQIAANGGGTILNIPADIARLAADGIATGAYEILADDTSRQIQSGLAAGVAGLYPQLP
jgi:hypothetical protein